MRVSWGAGHSDYGLEADKEVFFKVAVIFLRDTWQANKHDEADIPSPLKVNKELAALKKAISRLSGYTRRELIMRERVTCPEGGMEWIPEYVEKRTAYAKLQNEPEVKAVTEGKTDVEIHDMFAGEHPFPRWYDVLNGKSSLETLERLVENPYVRESSVEGTPGRADGLARKEFKKLVFTLWDYAGGITWDDKTGKASPIDKSKFRDFLQWLSEEVETPDISGFDAVTLYNDIFSK